MWRRYLLAAVSITVSGAIAEYVNSIADVQRRAQAIEFLTGMKKWLAGSSNKTKRAIAELIPF